MSERMAKFKAGEVVAIKDGSYGKLVTPKQAHPDEWTGEDLFDADGNAYVNGAGISWYHISEFRKLTKRERGQP